MHCENLSACCSIFASSCGLTLPPFGAYFRHACCAFLNCGELASSPNLPPLLSWPPGILMFPLLSGWGKFRPPFLRMHSEYAAGSALPEPPDELEPFALAVV